MAYETLEKRLSALELKVQELVTVRDLEAAVQAVRTDFGVQILQLRGEVQTGFSALREALRDEIRAGDRETRAFVEERLVQSAEETRTFVDERIERRTTELLAVIAAEGAEGRRHARLLHEDVIARIAAISRG
jgi:hypothetical protein